MKGKDLLPPKKKEGESKFMTRFRELMEDSHFVTTDEMGY